MKTKKLLSLILALAMAFSLAVPAFATTSSTLDNTDLSDPAKINTAVTTVSGTYQAPILALTVPKKIGLSLNPYGREVTINKDTALEEPYVQRQIVSADNLIISRSNVEIAIKATATGTITAGTGAGEAWTLSKVPLATGSVKKEALVYMVFGDVDTSAIDDATKVGKFMEQNKADGKLPYEGITIDDIEYATVATDLANITFADATTAKDGIIIQAGEGKETLITKTLSECIVTETGDSAAPYQYDNVSAVAFKMDGAMIANPKDASWGTGDKLNVSVAWKFVPNIQDTPMRINEYMADASTGGLSVNLAQFITDENTVPAFILKTTGVTGASLTQAGTLGITNDGLKAKAGATALATGQRFSYKLKFVYTNNATTPLDVTKNVIVTVRVVDKVVAEGYVVAAADTGAIDPAYSVTSGPSLSGAPAGVSVALDGKITATKAAVEAANGGTAPVAGDIVYVGPFHYRGTTDSGDIDKIVVLKLTVAAS